MASQGALVGKNPTVNAGDTRDVGLISGLGRSPAEGLSNPLQYSCLETPMDRGAWQGTVHRARDISTYIWSPMLWQRKQDYNGGQTASSISGSGKVG